MLTFRILTKSPAVLTEDFSGFTSDKRQDSTMIQGMTNPSTKISR